VSRSAHKKRAKKESQGADTSGESPTMRGNSLRDHRGVQPRDRRAGQSPEIDKNVRSLGKKAALEPLHPSKIAREQKMQNSLPREDSEILD